MTTTETPTVAVSGLAQGEGGDPAATVGPILYHGPRCFTEEQRDILLRGINTNRIEQTERGGRRASYLQAYDVRAHLTRIFGFANWSENVIETALCFEDAEGRTRKKKRDGKEVIEEYAAWTVCYRATVEVTINCPHGVQIASYVESAADTSDAQPQRGDAHHNALAAAVSTALKRAASNLGDQFGLSLYRKGATAPLIVRSLVAAPTPRREDKQPAPDEHINQQLPHEEDATREPRAEERGETPDDIPADMPAAGEGAPRGPAQIEQDALAAKNLPVNVRMAALGELMTELAQVGPDLAVKAVLIREMQAAKRVVDAAAEVPA